MRLPRVGCCYYLLFDSILTSVVAIYLFSCKPLHSCGYHRKFNREFCLGIILATLLHSSALLRNLSTIRFRTYSTFHETDGDFV